MQWSKSCSSGSFHQWWNQDQTQHSGTRPLAAMLWNHRKFHLVLQVSLPPPLDFQSWRQWTDGFSWLLAPRTSACTRHSLQGQKQKSQTTKPRHPNIRFKQQEKQNQETFLCTEAETKRICFSSRMLHAYFCTIFIHLIIIIRDETDKKKVQTYHFVVGKSPEVLCEMKKKKEKDESIAEGERSLFLGRQEGWEICGKEEKFKEKQGLRIL